MTKWRDAWQLLRMSDGEKRQHYAEQREKLRRLAVTKVRFAVVHALNMGANHDEIRSAVNRAIDQWVAVNYGG